MCTAQHTDSWNALKKGERELAMESGKWGSEGPSALHNTLTLGMWSSRGEGTGNEVWGCEGNELKQCLPALSPPYTSIGDHQQPVTGDNQTHGHLFQNSSHKFTCICTINYNTSSVMGVSTVTV